MAGDTGQGWTAPGEPGGGPGGDPGGRRYGGLLRRLGARILDGLVVGISVTVVFALLPGLSPTGVGANVATSLLGFAYFLVMETSRGATLGKAALGLVVTDESGRMPITQDASLRRNWWLLLGALAFVPLLGLLASLVSLGLVIAIAVTISSDPANQGWHDKLGGTLVLEQR